MKVNNLEIDDDSWISGDDEFNLMVWWTTTYTFFVYWGFGLIYTVMDLTNKPKFLRRYKIQPNTNEPVETKKLIRVIGSVIFNQIFVGIPFAIFSFYLMKLRGMPDVRELPTFHWVLFEIGICILVEEFGFYYSHRLMHSKKIYKHIHKQHHLWQAPVAVTAIYAHPIGEKISANQAALNLSQLFSNQNTSSPIFSRRFWAFSSAGRTSPLHGCGLPWRCCQR
jgi:fatty acid hydroxylase domain-containing protein 2